MIIYKDDFVHMIKLLSEIDGTSVSDFQRQALASSVKFCLEHLDSSLHHLRAKENELKRIYSLLRHNGIG